MTTALDPRGTATNRYPALPVLAVLGTVVAWASAFVAIRSVGESFGPGALALGRLALGSAALGTILVARRRWVVPTRREWALLVGSGLAWFATYNLALNAAEQRIDAGTTAMLVNVGPILLMVLAGVFLGEGFPRWLVAGLVVAFGGALLIGLSTTRSDSADMADVLLCLVAAVGYAVGVICQKPTLRRLPALQVTWLACTVGALACAPATGSLVDDLGSASGRDLVGLVYLGLVPLALAFTTWAYALARMPAGKLGVSTYLVPPITVLLGWLLLSEVPTRLALGGGAVCLVGVALSRRTAAPARIGRGAVAGRSGDPGDQGDQADPAERSTRIESQGVTR